MKLFFLILFFLFYAIIYAQQQPMCVQRNADVELARTGAVVMIVQSDPETGAIVKSHTGYLVPIPNKIFEATLLMGFRDFGFWIMTDAQVVDRDDNGEIDSDWRSNTHIVFKYYTGNNNCASDLPNYRLSNPFPKLSNFHANIHLFSPRNEYGLVLFEIPYHSVLRDIESLQPLQSFDFSILPYNNESADIAYHPFLARSLKMAKLPILQVPDRVPPGTTGTRSTDWYYVDKLTHAFWTSCPRSNVDDFGSTGAPAKIPFFGHTGIAIAGMNPVIAQFSRTDDDDASAACTDEKLWFVNFSAIWNKNMTTGSGRKQSLADLYADEDRRYFFGIDHDYYLEIYKEYINSPFRRLLSTRGIIFDNKGAHYYEQSDVGYKAPSITLLYSDEEPFTLTADAGASVELSGSKLITLGGEDELNLGLTAVGPDANINVHFCDLVNMKGLLPIRAVSFPGAAKGDAKIDFSYRGGNTLHIGKDAMGASFFLDRHTETVMFIHGNLDIHGIPILPRRGSEEEMTKRLQLVVTGDIFWNTDHIERERSIQGGIQLSANRLVMQGKTFVDEQTGKMEAWITDKTTVAGDWIASKNAQVQIWTKEILTDAGNFVAKESGEIKIFYSRNSGNASLKRKENLSARLKVSGGGKIKIVPASFMPPAPEGPSFPNFCPLTSGLSSVIHEESNSSFLSTDSARVFQKEENRLYPNPFTDQLNINVMLEKPATALQLQIYDQKGILMHQQVLHHLLKGQQTISWKATAVPNGIYFIRLIDEKGKLIVQQKAVKLQ